jgi:hypothetical protein
METKALVQEIGVVPLLNFIDGLANMDITKPHIERMIDDIHHASLGHAYKEVAWVTMGE